MRVYAGIDAAVIGNEASPLSQIEGEIRIANPLSHQQTFLSLSRSSVTNGGKTTLVHRLMQHFAGSVVMHQDEFYIVSCFSPFHVFLPYSFFGFDPLVYWRLSIWAK